MIDLSQELKFKKEKEKALRNLALSKSVTCEVCRNAIPESSVFSREVNDYVMYFCGTECYVEWEDNNK